MDALGSAIAAGHCEDHEKVVENVQRKWAPTQVGILALFDSQNSDCLLRLIRY